MNYNILIAEDHALTSFALKTSITSLDFVENVFEAPDAKNVYEILKNNNIHLILMDLGLGNASGVDVIKKIRETNFSVKIIVLTSHCEKKEVLECLEAGISAYCTKDIKPEKLLNVVKDVLEGSMYFDSSVSKFVMQSTSMNALKMDSQISVKDCYNLTAQEKRVLILLASGNNNSQIAKKLDISINTTKVHVCSILQKMNVEDRTQAAIKAIRENLIN